MARSAKTWIGLAAVLGVLALLVLLFLRSSTQTYRIPSESMVPTLKVGDKITVNKDAYSDEEPELRDLVVIRAPEGAVEAQCGRRVHEGELCPKAAGGASDVSFVERIVAGPGDRLRVRDGRAIVNGRPLDEPYAQRCGGGAACTFRGELTIPDDHYFLMGDNRGASDDSRFWGPIARDQIVGRVDDCLPLGIRCRDADLGLSG